MRAKPTLQEILEAQAHFNLPSPALVEKDWYVVRALAALSSVKTEPLRLVFGGGTALSRAHRLTRRMSEDIDFRIVSNGNPSLAELRKLREKVTESLLTAGFTFEPNNPDHRDSRNEGRHTIYRLPYPAEVLGNGALRPEIKIETSAWPIRLDTVTLNVGSFLAEAFQEPVEVPEILCSALSETLAEKFVALTRRVGQQAAAENSPWDKTLVRHIYDLHVTRKKCNPSELTELAARIVHAEVLAYGHNFPAYQTNPIGESLKAVDLISSGGRFAEGYAEFLRDMAYGEKPNFKAAMRTLRTLANKFQAAAEAKGASH